MAVQISKRPIEWIREKPVAHRGLHDKTKMRFENSLSAIKAAVDHGYAIEVDLHPSRDLVPMVFHDNTLERMTNEKGSVRKRTASELGAISLGGSADHVPTLEQLLETVDGKSGLVIELKGVAGEDEGFVPAVLDVLDGYHGNAAIMSFGLWLLEEARALGTDYPVGLVAQGGEKLNKLHEEFVRDFDIDFVSYGVDDLPNEFVAGFRASGKPAINWTVRSEEQAKFSYQHVDQITFEGFLP